MAFIHGAGEGVSWLSQKHRGRLFCTLELSERTGPKGDNDCETEEYWG